MNVTKPNQNAFLDKMFVFWCACMVTTHQLGFMLNVQTHDFETFVHQKWHFCRLLQMWTISNHLCMWYSQNMFINKWMVKCLRWNLIIHFKQLESFHTISLVQMHKNTFQRYSGLLLSYKWIKHKMCHTIQSILRYDLYNTKSMNDCHLRVVVE